MSGPSDLPFTALVLAARRGPHDAVAAQAGYSHKCLVPACGEAMVTRVLKALIDCPSVGAVAICIDDAAIFDGVPAVKALIAAHDITLIPAAETPSRSVTAAMAALDAWPVLVTTADLPLLTPEIVDHFCRKARADDGDIAVGLAAAPVVLGAYPEAKRTFLRFRDGGYSGCNLFALMGPRALKAVAFWRRVEPHRKRPWRLLTLFGPMALIRFLAGGATLKAALGAASARLGVTARAVAMPFADAAVDVDKPADLDLVEQILRSSSE